MEMHQIRYFLAVGHVEFHPRRGAVQRHPAGAHPRHPAVAGFHQAIRRYQWPAGIDLVETVPTGQNPRTG